MKRSVLSAALAFAALVFVAHVVFATGEEDQWVRTTKTGAVADFTIQHSPELVTTGSVRISQTWRWSVFTGAELIEEVSFDAGLTLCHEPGDCHKVWMVEAYERFDFPSPLSFDGLETAYFVAELTAMVYVYDFEDANQDGDFSELVGVFTAPVQLEFSWVVDGEADSSVSCKWNGREGHTDRHTTQEASVEGLVSGHDLTESRGDIFQHDHTQILNPKSEDYCLEERGGYVTLLLGNTALFLISRKKLFLV